MRYLLDTCVVSELAKPSPDETVARWADAQVEERLYLGVLSLGELRSGIDRMPVGRKKTALQVWLEDDLKARFADRWLDIDAETAERWGVLSADAARIGVAMPIIDGLLAATALVHGMTFVTRNESDVRASNVLIFNPWTSR